MSPGKLLIAVSLAAAVLVSTAAASRVYAAEDETFGLPDAPGREEVFAYCGACHSMRLVVQQGLTRKGWAETLIWMYEEQEMPELEPGEEKLVLDYLAKYVDPESQKQRLRDSGILR